jgi:membrane-associated protein
MSKSKNKKDPKVNNQPKSNSNSQNRWMRVLTSEKKADVGAQWAWWLGLVVLGILGLVALYLLYKLLHVIDVEQIGVYIKERGALIGYIILAAIIFAESGLFFGFFLPGDSLLLTAGLLSSKPAGEIMNVWILIPSLFIAAVLGDSVGYWFGQKTGPPLFSREESLFFRPKNLLAAKKFYDDRGGVTIVLARFMPFIRTFAPIVAGAVSMPYVKFLTYNLLGGGLWAIGLTLLGHYLGAIPGIDNYFTILVLVVILVSASPTLLHLWSDNKEKITHWVRLRFF